jgi:transposase-like protein
MGRKPIRSSEEKLSVVLAVLKGEMIQVEVARRLELSQTTVSKWLKQFTEAGLEAGRRMRFQEACDLALGKTGECTRPKPARLLPPTPVRAI